MYKLQIDIPSNFKIKLQLVKSIKAVTGLGLIQVKDIFDRFFDFQFSESNTNSNPLQTTYYLL